GGAPARAGWLRARAMTAPPAGAGAVRVTVPLALSQPPTTLAMSRARERTAGEGHGVLFRKTEIVPLSRFPTATSGLPSPLKSPMATVRELFPPDEIRRGGRKFPLPVFCSTEK